MRLGRCSARGGSRWWWWRATEPSARDSASNSFPRIFGWPLLRNGGRAPVSAAGLGAGGIALRIADRATGTGSR
eukprot:5717138-Alexandrium_andersonii.AAC.1